jgi:hypothetical protein
LRRKVRGGRRPKAGYTEWRRRRRRRRFVWWENETDGKKKKKKKEEENSTKLLRLKGGKGEGPAI